MKIYFVEAFRFICLLPLSGGHGLLYGHQIISAVLVQCHRSDGGGGVQGVVGVTGGHTDLDQVLCTVLLGSLHLDEVVHEPPLRVDDGLEVEVVSIECESDGFE